MEEETNLFYTQEADGILGMTRGSGNDNLRPIYDIMFEQGLTEQRQFSLCLGKDGGYFQVGGTDETNYLAPSVSWVPFLQIDSSAYRISLKGISMNGHLM